MDLSRIKDAYESNPRLDIITKLDKMANYYSTIINTIEQEAFSKCYNFISGRSFEVNYEAILEQAKDKLIGIDLVFTNQINDNKANVIPHFKMSPFIVNFDGNQSLNIYFHFANVEIRHTGYITTPIHSTPFTTQSIGKINLKEDEAELIQDSKNYWHFAVKLSEKLIYNSGTFTQDIADTDDTEVQNITDTLYFTFNPLIKDIDKDFISIYHKGTQIYDYQSDELIFHTSFYLKGNEEIETERVYDYLINNQEFFDLLDQIVEQIKYDLLKAFQVKINNELLDDIIVDKIKNSDYIDKELSLKLYLDDDPIKTDDYFTLIDFVHCVVKENKLYLSVPYLYFKFENKDLYIPLSETEINKDNYITLKDNLALNKVIPVLNNPEFTNELRKRYYLSIFNDDHFYEDFMDIMDNIFIKYGIKSGVESIIINNSYSVNINIKTPKC